MKEAQPIAEPGAHVLEGAQALRAGAAAGGDRANTNDASAQLAPEEADRFAMAFRPSWEPLAPDRAAVASARARVPSVGSRASSHPPAQPHDVIAAQDELLRLRGRRARKRSLALAAVSVLSFASLVYWGISSTTSGTEHAATQALTPLKAAPLATAPEPEHADVDRAAARLPEPTGLTARLADPSQPAANTQAAVQPEGDHQALPTDNAPGGNPEQASATAAPVPTEQPDQANSAQAAAVVVDSATSIQPATAMQAPAALQQPAASQQPAVAAAPAAEPKPTAATAVSPASEVKLTAAPPAPRPQAVEAKPAAIELPRSAATAAATTSTKPENTPAAVTKAAEPATAPRPPLLVVRAVPDGAQLWLDGQRMPNPFDMRLPLGSKHKIEARQEGYELSSQTIRLEADARLTITLRRETPAPEPHIKVHPLPDGARGAGFVTANPY